MNDLQEYIEAYFKELLNDTEKRQFEERCVADSAFAKEVALYITSREALRQTLLAQKKQQWNQGDITNNRIATITLRRWLPYAAAACILLAVLLYLVNSAETPHKLADKYITENYIVLSQTMNASADSLEQGIAAYNDKEYNKALQIFENIYRSDPANIDAKEYTGLVYLVTKDYDKALQHFHELAGRRNAFGNPGLFLQAITLLARNKQGDKAAARQLLERVVKENAEGNEQAKEWLDKW